MCSSDVTFLKKPEQKKMMQEKNMRKSFEAIENTFQNGTCKTQALIMCLDYSLQAQDKMSETKFFSLAGEDCRK